MIIEYVGEKKKKENVCFPIWERHSGQQCEQDCVRNGNHGDSESCRLAISLMIYISFGWIVTL